MKRQVCFHSERILFSFPQNEPNFWKIWPNLSRFLNSFLGGIPSYFFFFSHDYCLWMYKWEFQSPNNVTRTCGEMLFRRMYTKYRTQIRRKCTFTFVLSHMWMDTPIIMNIKQVTIAGHLKVTVLSCRWCQHCLSVSIETAAFTVWETKGKVKLP